jgi:hypothetical protein
MTDKITREDFAKLAAPFAAKDHEFIRGYIYIEETAICSRIEEVDFSWEWKTVSVTRENDVAVVVGALTINGITRYGTGQQVVQRDAKGGESVGEAAKGATTDALKRAARLFGIGRYLLQCPKEVKDEGPALNKWLASLSGQNSQRPAPVNTSTDIHWSMDADALEKMYQWANDKHKVSKDALNREIASLNRSITNLSKNDVMVIVDQMAKKKAS